MMEAKKETYSNQRLPMDSSGPNEDKKMWAAGTSGVDIPSNDNDDSSVLDDSDSSQKMMGEDGKKSKKRDFPLKLYQMLQDSKSHGHEHIISWDPDGKSFKVHQPDEFVAEVMPKYFNQTKYRSFQRMLNLYNFKKIIIGPMRGGYIHPKFHRDNKELCYTMKIRTKSYTKSPSKAPSKDHTTGSFPIQGSSDRIDFQSAGSSSVHGYENEVWQAQKVHEALYDPFVSSLHSRQDLRTSASFYQHDDTEMNEAASSNLDFSSKLVGHQPLQQNNNTGYFDFPDLPANLNHHPWHRPSAAAASYDHSMPPPPAINNFHVQPSNIQDQGINTEMNVIDYHTLFNQPLDDDLEPRPLPPPH